MLEAVAGELVGIAAGAVAGRLAAGIANVSVAAALFTLEAGSVTSAMVFEAGIVRIAGGGAGGVLGTGDGAMLDWGAVASVNGERCVSGVISLR